MTLEILLAILLTVAATLGVAWLVLRLRFWKETAETRRANYANLLQDTLREVGNKARAEQELAYLKQSIAALLSRPVIASLTDKQAVDLAQAVAQYLHAVTTPPGKMN